MKNFFRIALMCTVAAALVFAAQGNAAADDGDGWTTFNLSDVFAPAKKTVYNDLNLKTALAGFTQVRFTATENDRDLGEVNDEWKLLRMRLKAKMTADPGLTTFFQLDLMQDYPVMDAFIKWKKDDFLSIQAGQFVIPFGWQMPISPYSLETINYGQSIKLCPVSGAFRDQGILFAGTIGKKTGKESDQRKHETIGAFDWKLGFFNANGRQAGGAVSDDSHMGMLVRLGFQPIRPWKIKAAKSRKTGKIVRKASSNNDLLSFGINIWQETESLGSSKYKKGRFAFDFRLRMKKFIFQGEIWTNSGTDTLDVDSNGNFVNPTEPGEAKAMAMFFEFGYEFEVYQGDKTYPAQTLTPMLKIDMLDCDADRLRPTDAIGSLLPLGKSTVVALGFNYKISSQFYLQMFYEIHMEELDKEEVFGPPQDPSAFHNDVFMLQMNVKF